MEGRTAALWSVLRNLWMGSLLSSGYAEDTRFPAALPAPACPSQLPALAVQPRRPSESSQPAGAVRRRALPGLILQSWVLVRASMVLAWTAGSQYLVNAAAHNSGAISWVYQGKARQSCSPAKRQTGTLRSEGRQMATRPRVTSTPLASQNQPLAGIRYHTRG